MTYLLADINDLKGVAVPVHPVVALVIQNGKRISPAYEALAGWKQHHLEDYKKILKVMYQVSTHKRVTNPNWVKKDRHGEVYEMRAHAGHARLMFFYAHSPEMAICVNAYWKTNSSEEQQERAFEKAREYRMKYLSWLKKHEKR